MMIDIDDVRLMVFAEMVRTWERKYNELILPELLPEVAANACAVRLVPGRKYIKVDVGQSCGCGLWSGRYMVDDEGNIYGIKAYGQANKRKGFGTLDNPCLPKIVVATMRSKEHVEIP